jgi:membrane protein YdbS with pleckstrin-like domain
MEPQAPQPETPSPTPGNSAETGEIPEIGEIPTPFGFNLDPGEKITRIIHRSIFDFLPSLLISIVIFLAALALIYAEARFGNTFPCPPMMVFALVLLLLALSIAFFLIGFHIYRSNVLIFTTEHLIQVEVNSLFSHRVSQIAFSRVQDVSGTKIGVLQTLFNFGNVEIQSAGEEEKFIFRNAPDPQEIADEALEIHEAFIRRTHQSEPSE